MKNSASHAHENSHHDTSSTTLFGFWVYLLTDFVVFATLFATYIVLHHNAYGGPTTHDLFDPEWALGQTLILLTSSFVIGLGCCTAYRHQKKWTFLLFGAAFLLGVIFLWMEWADFTRFSSAGYSWQASGFLSIYYTLIGTHAVHVVLGLIWFPVILIPIWRLGFVPMWLTRLNCLKIFWQFVNVIWVFIFSIVFLMGVY